nr:glycosyltransferase [Actinomycetales bacterium]
MTWAIDVVVAIPAQDEEETIGDCLDSVLAAAEEARRVGLLGHAGVAVVAHACGDETARVARQRLDGAAVSGAVVEDHVSRTIAEVRRRAVAAAMAAGPFRPTRTWVFNTDADSLVPPDWFTGMHGATVREDAAGAAGMVEVWDWAAPAAARAEYGQIIARGIHGDSHDHVYGANLVLRLDAYLEVGGFEPVEHGEDHGLVRRIRAAGHRVATPLTPVVRTSGREDARCPNGLGALLRRLAGR